MLELVIVFLYLSHAAAYIILVILALQVEQFVISDPTKSWEEFDRLIANAEDFHRLLELPYRVVNIVSGKN